MRKSHVTTKRVLGAVLATGLAAAATVSLASVSDAATVAKLKADTTTSAGATLTVTGKDLLDENGAPQFSLTGVRYSSATCASSPATAGTGTTGYTSGSAANSAVAISDTKFTVSTDAFVPVLTAGKAKYNVCVYDSTGALFGTSSTTFYSPPAPINIVGGVGVATLSATSKLLVGSTVTAAAGANLTGPTLGGTKISVKGVDFTSKTYITVGGKKLDGAKTALAKVASDPDVITGAVPSGSGTQPIKIVGEFGSYPVGVTLITPAGGASGGALSWVYTQAVSVSPAGSDGAADRVLTVTGAGFDGITFSNSFSALPGSGTKTVIAFIPGGTLLTIPVGTTNAYFQGTANAFANLPNIKYCDDISKVSDTQLTCELPSGGLVDGAYSVVVLTFNTTTMTAASSFSRGATYVAADF